MNASTKKASVFTLFKQAILGTEQNFTEGSINRAIFMLSIPMILEMAMESMLAVVDIFFISRLNDNDAVTAVGLTESIIAIVYSMAMGMGMAATAMVARRIGEKDVPGAAVAARAGRCRACVGWDRPAEPTWSGPWALAAPTRAGVPQRPTTGFARPPSRWWANR